MLFPHRGETGFTLTELLVVIVILGVLAAVAVPIFLNQADRAEQAALEADMASAMSLLNAGQAIGAILPASMPANTVTVIPGVGGIEPASTLTVSGSGDTLCVEGMTGSGDVFSTDLSEGVRNYDCAGYVNGVRPTITITGADSDVTTNIGGVDYRIVTWLSDGSIEVSGAPLNVEYLIVGGGGGGGASIAGGGGAGGMLEGSLYVDDGAHPVTVGAGGEGVPDLTTSRESGNGSPSSFLSVTAIGGGGGGDQSINTYGKAGGSGGGAAGVLAGPRTGGEGTPGQGHRGGDAFGGHVSNRTGAGGGGAGAPGGNGSNNGPAGSGGAGKISNITGSPVVYAGGGGGGGTTNYKSGGSGGIGGGGRGGNYNGKSVSEAMNGVDGTGGGGGGGARQTISPFIGPSGDGGGGVVILRWRV